MAKYNHAIWRYIPANNENNSTFKFLQNIETDSEDVPNIHEFYCIDHVTNQDTGQMRIKNHSAPDYCVSKYIGWSLQLPPVEKENQKDIYMIIHKSIDKIEFDHFLEPNDKRYTKKEWEFLITLIEKKFNKQKEWAKDGIKIPSQYPDGTQVFRTKEEFRAFSLGRRAYFLYHLVNNYKFKHLIQKLNIGYTNEN